MRAMLKLTLTLSLLLIFPFLLSANTNVQFDSASSPFLSKTCIKTQSGLSLNLEYQQPEFEQVSGDLTILNIPNTPVLNSDGLPAVPVTGSLFRLPPTSGVRVEIISSSFEVLSGVDYATYMSELDEMYCSPENAANTWYPENIAEVTEPMIFGDFRVAKLMTYPVQVNSQRREIRVYNNLEIQIHYEGTDGRNTLASQPVKISAVRLPLYRLLLDWDEAELDEFIVYQGDIQVIMRDNTVLRNAMSDWIEWKRQKGWKLNFLTDSDVPVWTSVGIRSELINRWEDNPFDYIVVIGDDSGVYPVPPGHGSGYSSGDFSYACVAGEDNLPDCGIGRISIETLQQALLYSSRVVDYERDQGLENSDWIQRSMLALFSSNSDIYPIMTSRYLRNLMLDNNFTFVDTAFISPFGIQGNAGAVASAVIEAFNHGISYYTSCGYLGTGLYPQTISMINFPIHTYPMCIDVTEGTGNWSQNVGINEAYIRSGNDSSGPIGGIGTATSGVKIRFTELFRSACGYSLFSLKQPQMGDMILTSDVLAYQTFAGIEDDNLLNHIEWLNLMGDPTVSLWSEIPQQLDVTLNEDIQIGRTGYTVDVLSNGFPVEGAWVTIYKVDDDEDLVITAYTNNSGHANIEFPVQNEGEYQLTVTKPNHQTKILTGSVLAPGQRLGISYLSVFDDNTHGTIGNGNGIAEAGETIGLYYMLTNLGNIDETNIVVDILSDDPWVDIIDGTLELGILAAGDYYEYFPPLLVNISPDAQNKWSTVLNFEVSSDLGDYPDNFPLELFAPEFKHVSSSNDENFTPGNTGEVTIELVNSGSEFSGGAANLSFSHYFITTNSTDVHVNAVEEGNTTSITFEVVADENSWNGFTTYGQLIINGNTGQLDTLVVPVTIGNISPTDPTGPDYYGYTAFESNDSDYPYAPENEFVEISPLSDNPDYTGEELPITDFGADQDHSVVIDLPFRVQYYGETFDQMTVCSNGWVAMGSQADIISAYDFAIPGPIGPDYMIAPYFDELFISPGASDICYYYDEANGRFIIEWFELRTVYQSHVNTFEVIFYDIEEYPTPTNDNIFDFVYGDLLITTSGYWTTSPNAFTAGIENGNQQDGLMLTHGDMPAPGIHTLLRNSSVRFTTAASTMTGSVDGTITDLASGEVIEGAKITVYNDVFSNSCITDDGGNFVINYLRSGINNFIIEADCYNTNSGTVEVNFENTVPLNRTLTHPEIELSSDEIEQFVGYDEEVEDQVTVYNTGNGTLTFRPVIAPPSGGNLVNYNYPMYTDHLEPVLLAKFPLTSDESDNNGAIFDGEFFWVAGSYSVTAATPNRLYKYSATGELIATYNQPVPTNIMTETGFKDLAWTGEYLYGIDGGYLFKMDVSNNDLVLVDQYGTMNVEVDFLTYNSTDEELYVGIDGGENIRVIDLEGNFHSNLTQTLDLTGACWNIRENTEDFYGIMYSEQSSHLDIFNYGQLNSSRTTTFAIDKKAQDWIPHGLFMTDTYDYNRTIIISVQDYGDSDSLAIWELETHHDWLTMDMGIVDVAPGDSTIINMQMRGFGNISNIYETTLKFIHNGCSIDNSQLYIQLHYVDDIEDPKPEIPLKWALNNIYPNPFNSVTNISFEIPETSDLRLKIFNLLGQEIADLSQNRLEAGKHMISFNGKNLASGIYFVNFEAGPVNEVRKIILLK